MAHAFTASASPPLLRNGVLDQEAVWQARVDLAACFRAAARLGLHEGICNHLSAMVPGSDELFLVNPYGWGFHEITASRLLVCDFDGNGSWTGSGEPEATAFYIHGRVHMRLPRARAAFHTHMPNATAMAMLDGPPLLWAGQTRAEVLGPHRGRRGLQRTGAGRERRATASPPAWATPTSPSCATTA